MTEQSYGPIPLTGEEIEGQVLQSNISRRVAGNWFIWSFRFFWFIWFDERERQDSPAYQIDGLWG